MDKRIDLNEFKAHADEYLKISNENFRVFRICQNDLECELTSHENQFSYLAQNPKFLIKLGPPLKYGEYVLPVYKLNKTAVIFKPLIIAANKPSNKFFKRVPFHTCAISWLSMVSVF